MKKSIIYLGIALVTFTNVISALAQQSSFSDDCLTQTTLASAANNHSLTAGRKSNTPENPETISVPTYQKTMEEIIADNNQIIESDMTAGQDTDQSVAEDNQIQLAIETVPASMEKTDKERIQEDIQIIEASDLNAILPVASKKSKRS